MRKIAFFPLGKGLQTPNPQSSTFLSLSRPSTGAGGPEYRSLRSWSRRQPPGPQSQQPTSPSASTVNPAARTRPTPTCRPLRRPPRVEEKSYKSERATLRSLRLLNRIPPVLGVRRQLHRLRLPEPPGQVAGRLFSCFSRDFALGRGEAKRVLARRAALLPQWAWRRGTGWLSSVSGSPLAVLCFSLPVDFAFGSQPGRVSGHLHTREHILTPRFLSPLGKNGQRLRASKSSAWETSRRAFLSAERTPGSPPPRGVSEQVRATRSVGRWWSGGHGSAAAAWFQMLCCWREPVH